MRWCLNRGLTYHKKGRNEKKMRCFFNRGLMVVMWVLVVCFIWVGLHLHIRGESMRRAEEGLVSMCEERARMLQDQFAVSVNHFHALAILISTFHYENQPSVIDQKTFAYYTENTAFERPLLNGVAYAQRVLKSERESFEKQQGWIIKTFKGEPAPEKDEYAAVIYSQKTVSYIEALDMMSGEEDNENILKARATGKAVLTKPFRLLGSKHLGVVLTSAVYRAGLPESATVEERIDATVGYLGGAFDVESLVENLLRQLAGNQEILVNVYDVTNESEPLIMYGPQSPTSSSSSLDSPRHISILDFGDPFRKHQMICKYREKVPLPISAITTPSGVFVICMLVGYIIFAAWSRFDSVKEDCRKMEELKVQAEAADVAKSQFLATVSHEIRTPMNGVLGMLDILLGTDLNSAQKDYAQTAQICGKTLISLINEVLDRAKIEAGKLELEDVPFDLRFLLDDVLSLFSSKSREKDIELAVFVSEKVPEIVIGDPGRFRQIVTNLVGNSIKFTERGHIFIQVHVAPENNFNSYKHRNQTEKSDQQDKMLHDTVNFAPNTISGYEAADRRNSWENFHFLLNKTNHHNSKSRKVNLVVSVEDTGIGIPVLAQDRVFTPFMQADSSLSRIYGGTGIGLSITKCLVELMGGSIGFVSKPKVGSTFTFTVVFHRGKKGNSGEGLGLEFGGGYRAVLVDKRPVRSSVTSYHLKRLEIFPNVVVSLRAATDVISLRNMEKVDILLIERDTWNPLTDNLLMDQMKQNGFTPKTILLSTSESNKAILNPYFHTVISKPLRANAIASCLRNIFEISFDDGGPINVNRQKISELRSALRGLLDGKRILVVDDNKVNLKVANGILKKYGGEVNCVESGKEALQLVKIPHDFDVCFMDVQMPEMDGFEATRQIRLMESRVNEQMKILEGSGRSSWYLPVLAMTADVIQANYEECIKFGMDGYISKPFDEEQLYQAISRFLVPNTAKSNS